MGTDSNTVEIINKKEYNSDRRRKQITMVPVDENGVMINKKEYNSDRRRKLSTISIKQPL